MATAGYLLNERPPTGLLVAQAVGITASTYLLGQNASLSFISVPALMLAPAPVAAQSWKKIYGIGKSFAIPLCILSAMSTAYVAYHHDSSSLPFRLNVAATMLFPCIVPYTLITMAPTNNKLMEKAASLTDKTLEETASGDSVKELLEKWAWLNLGRAAITGAGVIAAIWAALEKREVAQASGFGFTTGANRIS